MEWKSFSLKDNKMQRSFTNFSTITKQKAPGKDSENFSISFVKTLNLENVQRWFKALQLFKFIL